MKVIWFTVFVQFRCKVFIMSILIKIRMEFTVKYYRKSTITFILLIDMLINNTHNYLIKVKGVVNMAPRSYEANEQIKDERRNQILQSALKIFTRKGHFIPLSRIFFMTSLSSKLYFSSPMI